jgi:23S rRNA pseudouridine1911/1915/1917 synthase
VTGDCARKTAVKKGSFFMQYDVVVPADAAGVRLDVWLEQQLADCTRSFISRLIKAGHCTVEPGQAKAGYMLRGGEMVSLEMPAIEPMEAVAENIPLHILYEDEHLIAVNKAAGMVVHPAIGHARGTLVNALLGRYGQAFVTGDGAEQTWRPGIVHRLDQDTSGVMLVARTPHALAFLQDAFRERTVIKRYLALVAGKPRADYLEHAGWLGRHPKDFRKRCVLPDNAAGAKEAYTSAVVLERRAGYSVVEARPKTGRTHQIRVHLAALGHPILADHVYGRSRTWPLTPVAGEPVIARQALHAWTISFPHPAGKIVQLQAPLPDDLLPFIDAKMQPRPVR